MRKAIYVLIATGIFGFIMGTGCSNLETSIGSIAGAVFYSDGTTRVAGAWVRVYDSTGAEIIAEVEVDEQARYFVQVPEGQYLVMGAISQAGDYSGAGETIGVIAHGTTRYFFAIMVDPPTV